MNTIQELVANTIKRERALTRLLSIVCEECGVRMDRDDYAYGHDCESS